MHVLLIGTLLSALAATAQDAPAASKIQALEATLEPVRAKFDVPALGAAIVTSDGLVALGAVGERKRGSGVRVTVDDQWHLGSCTKAMTATLAARLVERGDMKWETTIAQALPQLKDAMHASWRDVPLEWLLQNRGGAPANPPRKWWSELWTRTDSSRDARAWFVGKLLEAEPETPPGTKFVYSNQGFMIAGAMLEALEKKSWEELIRAELFEPLHLTSAGFGAPGTKDELDQPLGHSPGPIEVGPQADNPPALGPAGTVHMSLRDWASFVREHLRGERGLDGLVKASTFAKLHTSAPGQDYAMGWGRSKRPWAGGDVLTHSGSNTMWFCVVWIAPEKDVAFLATTNIAGDSGAKACDAAVVELLKLRGLL